MQLIDRMVRNIETGYTQLMFTATGLADMAERRLGSTSGLLSWLNAITVRNVGSPDGSTVLVSWRTVSGRPAGVCIKPGETARVPRSAPDVRVLMQKRILRAVPAPGLMSWFSSWRSDTAQDEADDERTLTDEAAQKHVDAIARLSRRLGGVLRW